MGGLIRGFLAIKSETKHTKNRFTYQKTLKINNKFKARIKYLAII